jgi:hypothetical protein
MAKMRDLLDFLLVPVRRMPWRVATVFGALLGVTLVAGNVIPVLQPLGMAIGVATVVVAGIIGASRGREFDQGILAVLGAIVLANLVGAFAIVSSLPGTDSWSAVVGALDLPLPGMLMLGVPVGTVAAGVATWLNHRDSAAT